MVLYAPIKILSPPGGYNAAKINEEMKSSTVYLLLKSPDLYCTGGMPCTELMYIIEQSHTSAQLFQTVQRQLPASSKAPVCALTV